MNIIIKPKFNNTGVTFPQANNVYIIIKYIDRMTHNKNEVKLSSVNDDISSRQVDYYNTALKYLGLVKNKKPTELALHIMSFDFNDMLTHIVKIILEDKIFYDYYVKKDVDHSINQIVENHGLTGTTPKRRTSTIINWVSWCEEVIKENNIILEVLK